MILLLGVKNLIRLQFPVKSLKIVSLLANVIINQLLAPYRDQ